MKTEDGEVTYVLLLEPFSQRPLQEIARIVSRELKRPLPDVGARVRYGGGLVAESLSRAQSLVVAEALETIGVRVRSIDSRVFVPAPRGRKITALELPGESLRAEMVTGRSLTVAPQQVFWTRRLRAASGRRGIERGPTGAHDSA